MTQVAVTKTAQCKKCGDVAVAWVKSTRTGRYYLAQTVSYHGMPGDYTQGRRGTSGGTYALTHRPHKCDPDKAADFQEKIAGYAAARGVTLAEWWEGK